MSKNIFYTPRLMIAVLIAKPISIFCESLYNPATAKWIKRVVPNISPFIHLGTSSSYKLNIYVNLCWFFIASTIMVEVFSYFLI